VSYGAANYKSPQLFSHLLSAKIIIAASISQNINIKSTAQKMKVLNPSTKPLQHDFLCMNEIPTFFNKTFYI
jgi:hypothetical protein